MVAKSNLVDACEDITSSAGVTAGSGGRGAFPLYD